MADRPASWRMPTRDQMEKMASAVGRGALPSPGVAPDDNLPPEYWQALLKDARADVDRPGPGSSGRLMRLSQIPWHLLRASCRRCARTVEIQKADAVRLYGRTRSGATSASACWTTRAPTGPGAMRKTAAGRRTTDGGRRWRRSTIPRPCPEVTARRSPRSSAAPAQ